MIGEPVRTKEEVVELCQEVREYMESNSQQFTEFTFEEGVQAAIKWLYFKNEPLPTTLSKPRVLRYTNDD